MKSVLPLAHHKEFRQRFHVEENPVSIHLLHYCTLDVNCALADNALYPVRSQRWLSVNQMPT